MFTENQEPDHQHTAQGAVPGWLQPPDPAVLYEYKVCPEHLEGGPHQRGLRYAYLRDTEVLSYWAQAKIGDCISVS